MKPHFKKLARAATSIAMSLAIFFSNAGVAFAGFGITPPYVNNDRLTRGTIYHQIINLVRSNPVDDLDTTITMNVPGADDWFSVDKGTKFVFPKGQTLLPITITVHVPANADYKEYKGAIRIRTAPQGTPPAGAAVTIALGAQVDVDIKVVDKVYDFNVRRVRIGDLESGRTKWGLFFPGKIRFFMTIENTGNTPFGPTKVHFDIYDSTGQKLLESIDNLNAIEKLPAFTTKEIVAELPTRLSPGLYRAKYTIYKKEEIAQQAQISISISRPGTVLGYEGYGFDGLSLPDKLKILAVFVIPFVAIILFLYLLVLRRRRGRRRRR